MVCTQEDRPRASKRVSLLLAVGLLFLATRPALGDASREWPTGLVKQGFVTTCESCRSVLHTILGDDLQATLGFVPRFTLLPLSTPNAFIHNSGEIVVTTQLMKLINSDEELAFVLAHEVGHLVLSHTGARTLHQPPSIGTSQAHELEADLYAVDRMQAAEISPKAAVSLLRRLSTCIPGNSAAIEDRVVKLINHLGERSKGF